MGGLGSARRVHRDRRPRRRTPHPRADDPSTSSGFAANGSPSSSTLATALGPDGGPAPAGPRLHADRPGRYPRWSPRSPARADGGQSEGLRGDCRPRGPRSGSLRIPMPIGWRSSTTRRDATSARSSPWRWPRRTGAGPADLSYVVLNLSTSRTTRDLYYGSAARSPGRPSEIHVVERMLASRASAARKRRRHRPARRVRPGQLRGIALVLDLLATRARRCRGSSTRTCRDMRWSRSRIRAATPIPRPIFEAQLAAAHPEAEADAMTALGRRLGRVRASNTEPILRVIAEARELSTRSGRRARAASPPAEGSDDLARVRDARAGRRLRRRRRNPAGRDDDYLRPDHAADGLIEAVVRPPRGVPRAAAQARPARLRPARRLRPAEHRQDPGGRQPSSGSPTRISRIS